MWEIAEWVRIGRPVAEVQAQFADVVHHQAVAPHRGVTFRVLADSADSCVYEQVTRIGPFRTRQQFVLDRTLAGYPAQQVNRIVAGPFHGGSITFAFRPDGDGTAVTATVRHDPGRAARFAGPVLERVLRRSLAAALEEDRADLESGNYSKTRGR
jgi:hypothetical protein